MGIGASLCWPCQATGIQPVDSDSLAGQHIASLPEAGPKATKKYGIEHARLIVDRKGDPTVDYDIDKAKLGEGSYGIVTKAIHKKDGMVLAMKSIFKKKMKSELRFKQEINIMKKLDHPNIIKLHETFEDNQHVYLLMEICFGGELFDRIIDAGTFSETQVATLMKQILRALQYIHGSNIAHRDLKPENFLCSEKEGGIEHTTLKIIDFGLSCYYKEGQKKMTTKAGTPYYIAPEVLKGAYTQMIDIWSCGVIMYVLICGYPPFFAEQDKEVLQKVRKGQFQFDRPYWENVSTDAKDLIRNLLKMDERLRFTAAQALNDVWIKKLAPNAKGTSLQSGMIDNLKRFRGQNKMVKAALHIIASQLKESEITGLKAVFMELDSDNDGHLTVEEMKEGIQRAGLKNLPEGFAAILEGADADGNGFIDYTDFVAATLDRKKFVQEGACWSAFRVFDRDGNGYISQAELKEVLAHDDVVDVCDQAAIATILTEIDKDGDGQISFDEFMAMMSSDNQGGAGAPSSALNIKPRANQHGILNRTCTFGAADDSDDHRIHEVIR